MRDAFQSDELFACHTPAVELLVNLGYQYLNPAQLATLRGGRSDSALLLTVLLQQIRQINRIPYQGYSHPLSEANILEAIAALQRQDSSDLQVNNARMHGLLTQGVNLCQSLGANSMWFTLRYIDWETPHNNVFHVASDVTLGADAETIDLMLFVNGIPLVAIACAAPQTPLQAVQARLLRLQANPLLEPLFVFVQWVMAINAREACYAGVGARVPHWACWREEIAIEELRRIRQQPMADAVSSALYELAKARLGGAHGIRQERERYHVPYVKTAQDQALYAMCRPARLLDLVRHATLFEGGQRRLVRHHQYFAVEKALHQVRQPLIDGRRPGGLIAHADGSDHALSMAFLAHRLALAMDWQGARIVLISPRPGFGAQWHPAFFDDAVSTRALSGRGLLEAVCRSEAQIILSLPHVIASSSGFRKYRSRSCDIFLLIEESHEQPPGTYAKLLRKSFPNACYIGFSSLPGNHGAGDTALPLLDVYDTAQAQLDGLLVPLIYENRSAEALGSHAWLTRQTESLPPPVRDRVRKSAACRIELPLAERRIHEIALDISCHFRQGYGGSGLKGQLVAPDHRSALHYKAALDQLGLLDSALVLSGKSIKLDAGLKPLAPSKPRAANALMCEAFGMEASQMLNRLWHETIAAFGEEDAWHSRIIGQFMGSDKPELLIVVDHMLETPRAGVLYLARKLPGHTLLQALARVNRASAELDKPFGLIIDYCDNLAEDGQPIVLASNDGPALSAGVQSAAPAIRQLPVFHADCWALFRLNRQPNRQHDPAARRQHFEHELAYPILRSEFHLRVERFAETLNLALGHARFMQQCAPERLHEYKQDALCFLELRLALQLRYAERVGISAAETMLWRKLHRTPRALPQVTLAEPQQFQQTLHEFGFSGAHAQADAIAWHLLRHIAQTQPEQAALLDLRSKIQQAMLDFEVRRMDESAYLTQIRAAYAHFLGSDPACGNVLQVDGMTLALRKLMLPLLNPQADPAQQHDWADQAAQAFIACLHQADATSQQDESDRIKHIGNQVDDYLCDVMEKQGQIKLDSDGKDALIAQIVQLARQRALL
jgi:type I restriction enzyme R subunit